MTEIDPPERSGDGIQIDIELKRTPVGMERSVAEIEADVNSKIEGPYRVDMTAMYEFEESGSVRDDIDGLSFLGIIIRSPTIWYEDFKMVIDEVHREIDDKHIQYDFSEVNVM